MHNAREDLSGIPGLCFSLRQSLRVPTWFDFFGGLLEPATLPKRIPIGMFVSLVDWSVAPKNKIEDRVKKFQNIQLVLFNLFLKRLGLLIF
jgi:hypothetical protein